MVIGLMVISAIPTVTGVSFGVREQNKQNAEAANEDRMTKFNLIVYSDSPEVNGLQVVLKDEKAYLAPPDQAGEAKAGHPFTGFYIHYPHPDEDHPKIFGLVTTISLDPPMLNWLYADKDNGRIRYGNRSASVEHTFGPWDWTENEEGLTLEGWEGFVAVKEEDGRWGLWFDRHDDGLKEVKELRKNKKLLCSLDRKLLPDESQGK